MRCPKCGRETPDDVGFCPVCGSPVGLAYAQASQEAQRVAKEKPKKLPDWVVVCIVLLVIVIVAIPTLSYSMPWSKIKVIVSHGEYGSIGVVVLIDGISKALIGVSPGESIVGVWSVDAGTHTVQLDRGYWYVQVITHWFSPDEYVNTYVAPDGTIDFTYAYEVGPLTTKNVFITLS